VALELDGMQFLRSSDPVERLALLALAPKVAERKKNEMRAQAVETVNALGKSLKGGAGKPSRFGKK
jgi:hypothetical protein